MPCKLTALVFPARYAIGNGSEDGKLAGAAAISPTAPLTKVLEPKVTVWNEALPKVAKVFLTHELESPKPLGKRSTARGVPW